MTKDPNWKTNPQIQACKTIAQQFNKKMVIVLMLDEDTMESASYGVTGSACDYAGKLADVAYDAVMEEMAK